MGDHISMSKGSLATLSEIPFGDTIHEIEAIRSSIDDFRESNKEGADFDKKLLDLEENLRKSYATLAAKAANKVANWTPGPKQKP